MDTATIIDRIMARRGDVANVAAEEAHLLDTANEIYRDILSYHDWPWLRDQVQLRLYPLMTFTATVTQASAVVTAFAPVLTAAEAVYEGGWLGDANGEMHEILDVDAVANTITLREAWLGATATGDIDIWVDRYPVGGQTAPTWVGVGDVTIGNAQIINFVPALTAANEAVYEGGWVVADTGEAHRIVDIDSGLNTLDMPDLWIGPTTVGEDLELIAGTPEVEHILGVNCTSDVKGGYQVVELTEDEIDTYVSDRRYPSATNLIYWSRGGIDITGRPLIRFWPIPRVDVYVKVQIKRRPPDLQNAATSIPQMPTRWHHVIVTGVLAMLGADDGLSDMGTNRYLIEYTSQKDAMLKELAKTRSPTPRRVRRWDEARNAPLDPREWWRYVEQ